MTEIALAPEIAQEKRQQHEEQDNAHGGSDIAPVKGEVGQGIRAHVLRQDQPGSERAGILSAPEAGGKKGFEYLYYSNFILN
jgi:hypothetical protein